MDLAVWAKQTFVMMDPLTREGTAKIIPTCTYPLTGVGCVSRVYTDLAVFHLEGARSSCATCSASTLSSCGSWCRCPWSTGRERVGGHQDVPPIGAPEEDLLSHLLVC